MFRVFYILFLIIISLCYGIRTGNFILNNNYGPNNPRNGISDFIRLALRRRNAFKQCKNHLTKYKDSYKLKNNYVVVIYDTKNKIIRCIDKSISKKTARINWFNQQSFETFYIDNLFEETFDSVCSLFNERTTFDGVVATFEYHFEVQIDNPQKEKEVKNVNIPHTNKKLLNLNQATEEELTDLPGISIIQAKNAIKYREKNNGFSTLDEFFKKMRVTSHFQEELKYYLYIDTYFSPNKQTTEKSLKEHGDFLVLNDEEYERNNERIIDL